MDYSTDSDEDIYWGPYTLKEAKRDMQKYKPKKPSSRYTICPTISIKSEMSSPPTPKASNVENLKLAEELKNVSISSNPSIYVTPRDSMANNTNNSEFLKEISQAINAPSPTFYRTANDNSNFLESTFLKKVASNLTCDLDNIRPSLVQSPQDSSKVDDTFLDRVANNKTYNLDNVHQSLVENTVILSDDEPEQNVPSNSLNISYESFNVAGVKKEKLSNVMPKNIEKSIIEISSDESLSESINEERPQYENESLCDKNLSSDRLSQRSGKSENINRFLQEKSVEEKDFSILEISYKEHDVSGKNDDSTTRDSQQQNSDKEALSFQENELKDSLSNDFSSKHCDNFSYLTANDMGDVTDDSDSEDYSFDLQIDLDREETEENVQNELSVNGLQEIQSNIQLSPASVKTQFERHSDFNTEPANGHCSYKSAHSCSRGEHHSVNITQSSVHSEPSLESGIGPLNSTGNSSHIHASLKPSISNLDAKSRTTDRLSPVLVPEINLDQFNDTLEEIEMFLRQGEMKNGSSLQDIYNSPKPINHDTPAKMISSIPLYKSENKHIKPPAASKPFNSAGHQQKYFDVGNKPKPPTKNRKNLFKMPSTPSKLQIPNKNCVANTPNKVPSNSQFKNIQSPIGVYIKNTPRYTPMINVPDKELSSIPLTKSKHTDSKSKENLPPNKLTQDIPPVVYKPSKTQIKTIQKGVNLPPSIKKLCPEPTVIRHEAKYTSQCQNQKSLQMKLELDGNLTINNSAVDSSLISSAGQDISVWTTKQAFINK